MGNFDGQVLEPRHTLVFTEGQLQRLRDDLLERTPLESAAYLLAHPVKTPSGSWRLVVYESITIQDHEYLERSESFIELPPTNVATVLQLARVNGSTIVLAHSHPLQDYPQPSKTDLKGEGLLIPTMQRRVPDVPHARLIVGRRGVHTALFTPEGTEEVLRAVEVGQDVHYVLQGIDARSTDRSKYDRQVRAFGEGGQHQLSQIRVGIVGLGGTGSVAAQQLAHLGVNSFLLLDPDIVEASNLNRVVGTSVADIGRPKIEVARTLIHTVNSEAEIYILQDDVRVAEVARTLLDVDVILCCTDSQGSRAVLTQLAYQYLLPTFDMGVAIQATEDGISHISGRVQMLAPNLPCLLCSGVLDAEAVRRDLLTAEERAEDPYIVGAEVPQPAVISINSATASLAITMLLSAIVGIPVASRHQRLRLEQGTVSRIEGKPEPECPICSPSGALGRGDSWEKPGRLI